ncbi:MAG: sigma 54-interacting transcriptional regulator [Myxococcales bacterium]|nr:sigma 54-interacting transcriptional regulator [Myxococcales bacterium]
MPYSAAVADRDHPRAFDRPRPGRPPAHHARGADPAPRARPAELDAARADRHLVGQSAAMRRLRARVERYGQSEASVLLHGETGTGKELTAAALHRASPRAARPFVPVNCGAIPRELIDAELFGSVPGGYTGARHRDGLMVRADGGTLFLDEIGDLPLAAQVVLLRVLETGEIRPVGDDRPRRVDLRLVCATHRDLPAMVAAREFRADLYHRLATLVIEIPPLRDRLEDLPLLGRALVGAGVERLSPAAWAALADHDWPGNVRELRNVLVRALAEHPHGMVEPVHLRFDVTGGRARQSADLIPLESHLARYVQSAVERCRGNVRAAARALQVSPTTIYRYLAMAGQ